MIENWIFKQESNIDTFWYEDRKISLREYTKDLLLYWSGEEDKAEYALFDKTPVYENLPSICSDGRFGSYSKVSSPIIFAGENLESLADNIHVSFWLAANNINGKYTIVLTKKEDFPETLTGDYSFGVQPRGEIQKQLRITLNEATFDDLKDTLGFEIDPSYGIEISAVSDNSITLKSINEGVPFSLIEGSDGTDLLSLFDIKVTSHGTVPTEDITLVSLKAENSELNIKHLKDGYLQFNYSQGDILKTTYIDWDNNGVDFDHVEVDIDSSVMYVFLNGELLKAVLISPIARVAEKTVLTINGNEDNIYSYEEIIIKSSLVNKEKFTPPISQLTKYDTTRPYIDFHFSGKNIFNNSLNNLVFTGSSNISLVLNYDGLFYYYNNGAWRSSDGSFIKSNDPYTFADYISEFTFTGKDDLFIRAFFDSDGDTEAYLEELYFKVSEDSIFGDGSQTAAILVGEKEFEDDDEIEIGGKGLVINTDQGSTDIVFPSEDPVMTIDEIIDFLKSKYPEGITKIYKDNAGRIVLVSETKGDSAFITVSGDAAEILFGKTTSAQGTDQDKNTLEKNYEEFIESIKTYSTGDLIPIEINDDQIRLFLQEAINIYKKYRSDDVSTYKVQLKGSPEEGYEIPPVIQDQHDIIDILFRPLFPISFYNGFDNNMDDVISMSLVNALAGRGPATNAFYGQGLPQDYYISLMSIDTMEMALGLKPSWRVYNNRLYIFPNSISKYLTVTILYKSPIDPIEALRDPWIIQYVYGKIRMAQGEVRGQYGANLSSGGLQVQFNADSMYERGKQAVDKALEEMMKSQEPLGFYFY